ncbi:MAG: type II secretion system F family protein [Eggerthellales bacterium]|nr:type II secretion system F family protein [Eggerthellales bacterium]
MEGYGQVLIAAVASGFACATLGAWQVLGSRHGSPAGGSGPARLLRNGVAPLQGAAALVLRSRKAQSLARDSQALLQDRGLFSTPQSLASVALAALALVFTLGCALSRSWVGGVAAACLAVALAKAWVGQRIDARTDALRESIPEALRSMGACFQSGFSLMQTLGAVAGETKGSLSELFSQAAHVLQAGGTSADALKRLRRSSDLPELAFVSVALDVQHQTGGSMRRCLESAICMVEGELELRRSLRVQTAQARLSARVVGVMPFALIAVFSVLGDGFLDPFFESVAGMVLLVVALSMQAAGVLMVRSLLKVR